MPARFSVVMFSQGKTSGITYAQPLVEQIRIYGKKGRPSIMLLVDNGDEVEHLRRYCDDYGSGCIGLN